MLYHSIDDVKRANERVGEYFFSPSTQRFFRSHTGRRLYGGRIFVTSQQFETGYPREYEIHEALPDGRIRTLHRNGRILRFATAHYANQYAERLSHEGMELVSGETFE